ncbi:insulinase family protein [Acholeplasma sp. OttesenSCG-928-E16]|nr:insulinase family protein [Acholeplasma sp. OttesenSCG-928-E16]
MISKKNYPNLNENIYMITLQNGLRVFYLHDPHSTIFEARLIINFGAYNLEYEGLNIHPGTAHFLEHMMFKMEDDDDALMAFSRLGAEANAATSYSTTVYMFDTAFNFFESLELLFKMIDQPVFKDEEINKERAIIIEEINMYQSDINEELDNILSKNTYFIHPFKHDIGGSVDDVKKIDRDLLMKTYQIAYPNSNRILVLGGNINIDDLEAFLKKYDSKTKFIERKEPKDFNEPLKVVIPYQEISRDVDLDIILFKLKILEKGRTIKDEFIANIALSMLLGKTSSYYEELLKDELIGSNFRYYENIECKAFEITVENSCKEPFKYIERLKNIIFNTDDSFFTAENFNRYKKAFLGRFIFSLNSLKSRVRLFCEYITNDYILYDILELVKKIKLEDVVKMFNDIKKSDYTILNVKSTKG